MKQRIALHPDMTNVLSLQQPQSYQCRVVGYVMHRSLMVVSVTHQDAQLYVVFPDVHYYDGSFLWQGALLRVASQEEQFEYMLEHSVVSGDGLLFVFDCSDGDVHILGGGWIGILDKIPDRFK